MGVYGQQNPAPDGFVWIQGGTFIMGSPADEPDPMDRERSQHKVTISGFYMGKYEVTQKEYQEVMGRNPSHFKGDNLPVEKVNWYNAVEYCNMRSQKEGLTPAYTIDKNQKDPNNTAGWDKLKWTVTWNKNANGYRLPTEAEWEYACRAGTKTPFNTGNNITTDQANYDGNYPYNNNAKGEDREKTTPVGSFAPNPWGLYDMHGNVQELCWDWYDDYKDEAQTDPEGAVCGDARVVRGGSWLYGASSTRSGRRGYTTTDSRFNDIGLRLARTINN